MPALTSSMCAPAATCASASASTVLKSPAFISSASCLRPVGLIRSPIITNGRSKPMTTSRVAERDHRLGHARAPFRDRADRVGDASAVEPLARGTSASRRAASASASASRSSPQGRGSRAPLLDVGSVAVHAGAHRGPVDRHLEPRWSTILCALAPVLDDDLRGDVAPPDRRSALPAIGSLSALRGERGYGRREVAEPGVAVLECEPEPCRGGPRVRERRRGPRSGPDRRGAGSCRNTSAAARDGDRGRGRATRAGRNAGRGSRSGRTCRARRRAAPRTPTRRR